MFARMANGGWADRLIPNVKQWKENAALTLFQCKFIVDTVVFDSSCITGMIGNQVTQSV